MNKCMNDLLFSTSPFFLNLWKGLVPNSESDPILSRTCSLPSLEELAFPKEQFPLDSSIRVPSLCW